MSALEVQRDVLAAKFWAILSHLDERQRRLLIGAEAQSLMVPLVVVYGISGWECAGVCPGRTSTGEDRSLNRRRAIA
ncbi:hypothetical protein [Streptomyces sp. NBC_00658]|uniref:hypothetical protein n=1 Tax=Streptomyces sp. NBC_00658 TaxID=2975800 RepID=UPI003245CD9F